MVSFLYLRERSQSVVINSAISARQSVHHGVPQGSVLGPLLFSIYLLGIDSVFKQHGVQYILYADDIQFWIHSTVEDFSAAVGRAQQCVYHVKVWLRKNFLNLNEDKTEVIVPPKFVTLV